MSRRPAPARRQAGAALIALVAVAVLAFAYMLVSHLNAATGFRDVHVNHNARVLNQAKQALIGYVAQQAALGDDPTTAGTVEGRNPGSLPCPEAPASFNGANEGIAAGNCTLPAVGRLPWRTLGLDKLADAAGEPLWYVVSPGWALSNSTTPVLTTFINSNSRGQLTVDGVANDSVALIIAPGVVMNAPAAAGCTAWNQIRPTAAPPDARNYLECQNATGATFVTAGPSDAALNDQVLRVTSADLMPAIEAAIAVRIEREIAPQLRTVYASNAWGTNVSAANPMYPFPGQFADPNVAASYGGSAGSCDLANNVCEGLLPAIFSNAPGAATPCTVAADGPLCDPNFVRWQSGTIEVESLTMPLLGNVSPGVLLPGLLTWTPAPNACVPNLGNTPSTLDCTLYSPGLLGFLSSNVNYRINGVVQNVGMAMRRFDATAALPGVTTTAAPTMSTMTATGSVAIQIRGRTDPTSGLDLNMALCGLGGIIPGFTLGCQNATVSVPMTLLPDHALLNQNNATTGWFMRNRWYEVMYYSAVRSATAATTPTAPGCTTGTDCLNVSNLAAPTNNKRALLVLAGRSLTGTTTVTRTLPDFLDTAENRSTNRVFERLPVNAASNDRFVVVQSN